MNSEFLENTSYCETLSIIFSITKRSKTLSNHSDNDGIMLSLHFDAKAILAVTNKIAINSFLILGIEWSGQ